MIASLDQIEIDECQALCRDTYWTNCQLFSYDMRVKKCDLWKERDLGLTRVIANLHMFEPVLETDHAIAAPRAHAGTPPPFPPKLLTSLLSLTALETKSQKLLQSLSA